MDQEPPQNTASSFPGLTFSFLILSDDLSPPIFFFFFSISKQLIFWPGRAIHRCGGWQFANGFRLSVLITASWGLLGGVSTLREAGSFPIYPQAGGQSLAAHPVIQQEQPVTDCTFRGTVARRAGQGGGSGPTKSE